MICQSKLEKVAKKPGFEKVRQGINSLSDFVCIAIVTVELYRFRLHRNDLTTENAENTEGDKRDE